MLTFSFFFTSILLGVGLAMDAFSVSLANGLSEPNMRARRMCAIAGIFAAFQLMMPLAGWFFVHTLAQLFSKFEVLIPWIALGLLSFIGGKMLYESIKGEEDAVLRARLKLADTVRSVLRNGMELIGSSAPEKM